LLSAYNFLFKDLDVADHLLESFIRFAGASYALYVNVRSGTVGDG